MRGERMLAGVVGLIVPACLIYGLNASMRRKLVAPADALTLITPAPPAPPVAPPLAPPPAGGEAQPRSDVGPQGPANITLNPSRRSPVSMAGQLTQSDPRHWRIDLEIFNRARDAAAGHVWAVATVKGEDGRIVRVASARGLDLKAPAKPANAAHGVSYKARRMTLKSFSFELPAAATGGELLGVEVFATNTTGGVVTYSDIAH